MCQCSLIRLIMEQHRCVVCCGEAFGNNFGAFTCRACAAFFRRCHFASYELICRRGDNKCSPDGKWRCPKCRLSRCWDVGMTTSNIQYNRDVLKHKTTTSIIPKTVETVLGVPHLVIFLRRDSPDETTFVDVTQLLNITTNMCINSSPPVPTNPRQPSSDLEQLTLALQHYRTHQSEHLTELAVVTTQVFVADWQRIMQAAARWLNCSDWFRSMEAGRKVAMWRAVWYIWGKVDQMAMTAKMRVNRQCGPNQFVLTSNSFVDYHRVHLEMDWCSTYDYRQLAYFAAANESFYDDVICEIMRVKPNDTEMTFLICTICFELTVSIGGDVQTDAERLQQVLSDDLHNYYLKNNFSVYSHRLRQLLGIKEFFVRTWRKRMERFRLGRFFNILTLNFSDPHFFQIVW